MSTVEEKACENLEDATDEQLVKLSLDGSEDAKEHLMRRYYRKVYNISYKFVGRFNEAEDLTQEIFFKVFSQLEKFNLDGNFQYWLQRVAKNHSIDHYRKTRKEKQILFQENSEITIMDIHLVDQQETLERKERMRVIIEEINNLPPTLRDCLVMRDVQGYSYQEIAETLNLPVGTVKSRINRSRKDLMNKLEVLRGKKS